MTNPEDKILALNSLTAEVRLKTPEGQSLSKDPRVLALTMLRNDRFLSVQRKVSDLIEIIINEQIEE